MKNDPKFSHCFLRHNLFHNATAPSVAASPWLLHCSAFFTVKWFAQLSLFYWQLHMNTISVWHRTSDRLDMGNHSWAYLYKTEHGQACLLCTLMLHDNSWYLYALDAMWLWYIRGLFQYEDAVLPVWGFTLWNKMVTRPSNLHNENPHIDGLVQDCSISSANALEILQSCTKPSICEKTAYILKQLSVFWFEGDKNIIVSHRRCACFRSNLMVFGAQKHQYTVHSFQIHILLMFMPCMNL